MRLDRRLRDLLPQWTNVERTAALSGRRVTVDDRTVWMGSWEVDEDSRIALDGVALSIPTIDWNPAWVLFTDERVVVLNKPSGLRPEPRGPADRTDVLSAARSVFGDALVAATRLDRDTSGVMILTYPGRHRAELDQALRTHTVEKQYVALVDSRPLPADDTFTIRVRLDRDPDRREAMRVVERGGQSAITEVQVVDRDRGRLVLHPRTGRTHQLRVHLAHLGCPIVGDVLYGGSPAPRLMLHAERYVIPTLDLDISCPVPF
jgi:RluA family pseudouridine synthase